MKNVGWCSRGRGTALRLGVFGALVTLALIGPKERIRDRLEAWRETPVTTLIVGSPQPEALEVLAGLVL